MANGKTLFKAAGFMMLATLLARLLGMARDMVLYTFFGPGTVTDAYNAAFSLPDLIYMLLVGGALSSAFIPVFGSYLARQEEEEAWKVASIVLNTLLVSLIVLIILAEIYTRPLMLLLVPDLSPQGIELAVTLSRVMFIQTFFMALNGIALGILNSKQHFISPSIGSILYNVGIIGVGVLMGRVWGIMAFSVGVVAGSILSFAVQVPSLAKVGFRYYPTLNLRHPGFKRIIVLTLPVVMGLSVTQLNLLVNQYLASGLAAGSISTLRVAQRIMQLPVGIFGVAIATAVFPTMNIQAEKRELKDFRRTFSLGMRAIFLITVPAGLGLIALREPIIRLLFEQGSFTATDTMYTAGALLFYSLGLFAYSGLQLMNRVFYSLKDTFTPVIIGVVTVGINIVFSMLLLPYMQDRGLALAYSLAGAANLLLLLIVLKRRLRTVDGFKIMKTLMIATGASGLMYAAVRFAAGYLAVALHFVPKINELIIVSAGIALGIAVYAGIVLLFRLEETRLVLGILQSRLPFLRFLG